MVISEGMDASGSLQSPWSHQAEDVAQSLDSELSLGRSPVESGRRLREYGRNEIQRVSGPGPIALFGRQFQSLIIWVLILAAVFSAFVGERADALAIGAIVLLNAFIGFIQEFRAERALAALREMIAPSARVRRGGQVQVIPAAELVPGDLLLLKAGDIVGADARITESAALRVNEAPLTGESEPVDKEADLILEPSAALAERGNMVYLGTSVVAGQGSGLVTATGMATELGKIAALLQSAGSEKTPLQERLDRVGRSLLLASMGTVGIVLVLGLIRGQAPVEMLLTSVSLAVAAVPEGLPAVVTIALALGVARMARRNALIRRLPAVETLGATQVICTDKTGTLTRAEMVVRALWIGGREIEVTGDGYAPIGGFLHAGSQIDHEADDMLRALLFGGAAASDAHLHEDGNVIGDPTEAAVMAAAAKAGIHRSSIDAAHPRIRTIPFSSERKRMSIIRAHPHGPRVYTKGAPELLLERCHLWIGPDGGPVPLDRDARDLLLGAYKDLAKRALRVIGVAFRDATEHEILDPDSDRVESGLTLVGLMAMYDPPRPEARDALAKCRRAGIRVVMITGDHPLTARAIGRDLGIVADDGPVISGAELKSLSDEEFSAKLGDIAVYARVTAEDKLRIVRAFRAEGTIVAMTGDGVNDAPAVKEADIGIAMGRTGSQVTKEAAAMVITDDNFAWIVAAVEEGRGIFENIKKCLLYLLSGNMAEILLVLAAILVGWPLPLLPLHLLWINLVTDGLPALVLASDPPEPGLLHRPPRSPLERITDRGFMRTLVYSGMLTALVGLLAFWWGYRVEENVDLARSLAFTGLVFAELLKSLSFRSLTQPFWEVGSSSLRLFGVIAVSVLLQVGINELSTPRALFGLSEVPNELKLALLALAAMPLALLELRKRYLKAAIRPESFGH